VIDPRDRDGYSAPAVEDRPSLVRKCAALFAANLLLFMGYRVAFLAFFAESGARASEAAVMLYGLRLDVALLAIEGLVIAVLSLVMRRLRARLVLVGLWAFTCLNLLAMVSNLLFFHERNQHLWENVVANLSQPGEMWTALEPFLFEYPTVPLAMVLGLVGGAILARRHARLHAGEHIDLWRPRALAGTVGMLVLLVALNLEAVPSQKRSALGHRRIDAASSKYYAQFGDYMLNQAVMNPLLDLVQYVPVMLTRNGQQPYRIDATSALRDTTGLLGLPATDARFPLLRTIEGEHGLGVRNVILLQVEGFGRNVLERDVADGPLTPHLRQLAQDGLLFPNVLQSFCATDGSTFAIVTSLHRTYAVSEGVSRFFPHEVNGRYGALARALGPAWPHHYFFAGFRQRIDDFLLFMGNQGYEAFGYEQLAARLGPNAPTASSGLGIYDGPFLDLVADQLVRSTQPFTAHVVTSTSHSPWQVPPGGGAPLQGPQAAFRYADDSIASFMERLRRELPAFDRTLFVIFGDHTSITFTDGMLERIRVPLILYAPALIGHGERWDDRRATRGSHVDIVPTILGLLDGAHPYAGVGVDLLAPGPVDRGVISSNYNASLYVRDGFALRFAPSNGNRDLFRVEPDEIVAKDISAEHPETARRLTREYTAVFETTDRLTREKRVFPGDEALGHGALAAW
jgi:hypothetical protein